MEFLFYDPRPDLEQDTSLWTKMLRLIPKMEDKTKAELLQKRLWTIRCLGVMLRLTREGLKFEALIGPGCNWDNAIDFEEMKIKYLKPYAAEISQLLLKVQEL